MASAKSGITSVRQLVERAKQRAVQVSSGGEGRIRILGVTQEARTPALPQASTFTELGLPAAAMMRSWQGLFVRAGTPDEAVRDRLTNLGIEPVASPDPDQARAYYLSEVERCGRLLHAG